jgi:UDP-sulfoquinovose synthase
MKGFSMSHILILGGDGYLGWPTAMYFSNRGYEVTVVDNYFRRNACTELDVGMLYPVPTLVERANTWHQVTGKEIKVVIGDLTEPEVMRGLFEGRATYAWAVDAGFTGVPDTVMHYAEQPSAPYSLINYRYANITVQNNLLVTNNLMWALRDYARDTHVVHIGTMGEYGTPNIDIEEGWLDIEHKGRKDRFLFPRQASSLYHTTKIMDTDLMWFGVRMWGLRVTDLMQGPVYGIETEESKMADGSWLMAHGKEEGSDEMGDNLSAKSQELRTIFNYDEIFGTIVNRFVVQAVVGYPLTVYGKGGQTRGYLNIKDTLQCVHMAERKPAETGELRVFNQIMETFSANDLAEKVQRVGKKLGYDVQISHLDNPRKEAEEHYYNPTYQGLIELGVEPHYLTDEVLEGMFRVVERYGGNIRKDVIFKGIKWG